MEKEKGKGGKYLENENIWFMEKKKKEKEKEGNIFLARRRITEGEKEAKYHYKGKIVADWRREIKGSLKCGPKKMETSIEMRSRI